MLQLIWLEDGPVSKQTWVAIEQPPNSLLAEKTNDYTFNSLNL